jgi:hypothetical protein
MLPRHLLSAANLIVALYVCCPLARADALRATDLSLEVVDSDIEPSVTIQEHKNRVVEEYRVNNNLYMVKITPSVGAPYYLVDDDGSGDLEIRRDPGPREIKVPQWTLVRW